MAENQSTNLPATTTGSVTAAKGREKAGGGKTRAAGASSRTGSPSRAAGVPILKEQHAEIRRMVGEGIDDAAEFARVWVPHTIIEEEILAPEAEEKGVDAEILMRAGVERDLIKLLLRDILADPDPATLPARTKVLGARALELIDMEEKPRQGLIALAKASGVDLADIQRRAVERNNQLSETAERRSLRIPAPRSLRTWGARSLNHPEEKDEMPRQSNMRERDDQGRFMSDDDRYQGRGGRYGQSSRGDDRERDERGRFMSDDDDDRYRGRSGGGNGGNYRERDEQGRFMSEDDDRGHSGRSGGYSSRGRPDYDDDRGRRGGSYGRGADYDDDRRSSRGRGQGGWYGDPEGHSEASRRGWQHSDHGDSGWYGDAEGHSEASRRGWQHSDHGDSGWHGDPEGHSEASRRGWEGRRGSAPRYDERGNGRQSRSRSSDYDDDRRSSRGGGQGGWYGDPEGHSEASRRGWEDRR
jgi:hypothetical protein